MLVKCQMYRRYFVYIPGFIYREQIGFAFDNYNFQQYSCLMPIIISSKNMKVCKVQHLFSIYPNMKFSVSFGNFSRYFNNNLIFYTSRVISKLKSLVFFTFFSLISYFWLSKYVVTIIMTRFFENFFLSWLVIGNKSYSNSLLMT